MPGTRRGCPASASSDAGHLGDGSLCLGTYPCRVGLVLPIINIITWILAVGGAITGDNISVHHLYNIKRLAYEIQAPPPAAFAPGSTDDPAQRRAFSDNGYSAPAAMPISVSVDSQVEEIVKRVLMELKK